MFPRSPTPECFARKFESHCTMLGNLYLQATSALTVHNAPAAGWPARRDFVAPLASGNWISPHTDKASFAPGMSKTNSSCLGSLADPGLQYPLPASLCPAEEWSARSSNRPPSTEVDRLCQARYTWYSRVVDFTWNTLWFPLVVCLSSNTTSLIVNNNITCLSLPRLCRVASHVSSKNLSLAEKILSVMNFYFPQNAK